MALAQEPLYLEQPANGTIRVYFPSDICPRARQRHTAQLREKLTQWGYILGAEAVKILERGSLHAHLCQTTPIVDTTANQRIQLTSEQLSELRALVCAPLVATATASAVRLRNEEGKVVGHQICIARMSVRGPLPVITDDLAEAAKVPHEKNVQLTFTLPYSSRAEPSMWDVTAMIASRILCAYLVGPIVISEATPAS